MQAPIPTKLHRRVATLAIVVGASVAASVLPSHSVAAADTISFEHRVNAGGPAFVDKAGRSWKRDTGFNGGASYRAVKPIAKTGDDQLYQSERYGMSGYNVPVPGKATYSVRLHLAEIYFNAAGKRIFDVAAEGATLLDDHDIVATAGAATAQVLTFPVVVSDGVLNLRFSPSMNNAKISGIEVLHTAPAGAPVAQAGVNVFPGDSIQKLVDSNTEGTTFVVKSGVHARQQVSPKNGNRFIGEPGAILDGQGQTTYAFYGNARDVVIRGLEIRNYSNPAQHGAIHAQNGPHDNPATNDLSTGWLLEDLNVHNNRGTGVLIASGTVLRNSRVHHNGQQGLTARGGTGAVVDNVEVAYNNTDGWDSGWEAGGAKFKYTRNLTVRNSFIHHNAGTGLWTDIDNIHTTYENNRIEDNVEAGIHHEISYDAVIRNNTISRNGAGFNAWLWGAGIQVQSSANVEIYGNTVTSNANGISLMETGRGSGIYGAWRLRNVSVHDNIVTSSGKSGAGQAIGDSSVFDTLRFEGNTYSGNADPSPFQWRGLWMSWSNWQRSGNDATGTFS